MSHMRFTLIFCILLSSGCSLAGISNQGVSRAVKQYGGYHVQVLVDGHATIPATGTKLIDSAGHVSRTANWVAAQPNFGGRPCFEMRVVNSEVLGELISSSIYIELVDHQRERGRWRNYKPYPDPSRSVPYDPFTLKEGKIFCPEEYRLTDRLRYERLPVGKYWIAIRVNGTGSWDSHSLVLKVKD